MILIYDQVSFQNISLINYPLSHVIRKLYAWISFYFHIVESLGLYFEVFIRYCQSQNIEHIYPKTSHVLETVIAFNHFICNFMFSTSGTHFYLGFLIMCLWNYSSELVLSIWGWTFYIWIWQIVSMGWLVVMSMGLELTTLRL